MSQQREPGAQALRTRRQLDDLDSLLERLLELPLPAGSSSGRPNLQLLADLESELASPTPHLAEEPPAVVRIDQAHAALMPLPATSAPPAANSLQEAISPPEVRNLDPAPVQIPDPAPANPPIQPTVLPAVEAIPTITLGDQPQPALPWAVVFLAWLDRWLTAPFGGMVSPGIKQSLGWLGLLLLAGAGALALGRWLGQRW